MTDDQEQPPRRADILSAVPVRDLFALTGEFTQRLIRGCQTFMQYDPTQFGGPAAPLKLSEQTAPTIILADFSKPPYRKVERAFSATRPLAAGGAGNFQGAFLTNVSQQNEVIVLDYIDVGGGIADFLYGFTSGASVLATNRFGYYLETQQTNKAVGAQSVGTPRPPVQINVVTLLAAFVDGTDLDAIGINGISAVGAYTRIPLTDVVIYPTLAFLVGQLTANLALNVTFHGRVIPFTQSITQG